jgi:hypothetical protein
VTIHTIDLQRLLTVTKAVCALQAEHDAADHDTTTVTFMETHGVDGWQKKRWEILGEIDMRRTGAIWALTRLLAEIDKGERQ